MCVCDKQYIHINHHLFVDNFTIEPHEVFFDDYLYFTLSKCNGFTSTTRKIKPCKVQFFLTVNGETFLLGESRTFYFCSEASMQPKVCNHSLIRPTLIVTMRDKPFFIFLIP